MYLNGVEVLKRRARGRGREGGEVETSEQAQDVDHHVSTDG